MKYLLYKGKVDGDPDERVVVGYPIPYGDGMFLASELLNNNGVDMRAKGEWVTVESLERFER